MRATRTEQLAYAFQRRDAAQYGPVIDGVQHPTWDEIGDIGRDEYMADAKYAVNALDVIDRMRAELEADDDGKAFTRAEEWED